MAEFIVRSRAVKEAPGALLIMPSGKLTAHTRPVLEKAIEAWECAGTLRLILDMEEISHIDSTSIEYLVRLAERLGMAGGALVLMRLHPKVRVIFQMLDLLTAFRIFRGLPKAVEALRAPGGLASGPHSPNPAPGKP